MDGGTFAPSEYRLWEKKGVLGGEDGCMNVGAQQYLTVRGSSKGYKKEWFWQTEGKRRKIFRRYLEINRDFYSGGIENRNNVAGI